MPSITPAAGQLRLSSRRTQVIIPGLTQAYAGIARSGCTYSNDTSATVNYFDETLDILINGELRTSSIDIEQCTITMGLNDEPSTASLVVITRGQWTVDVGHDVQVWLGGVETGVPLFGGTVLQITAQVSRQSNVADTVCECMDYRWLMNRWKRVTATYSGMGFGPVVADLLATYTDPADKFEPGYIPTALGNVDQLTVSGDTVTGVLNQLRGLIDGGGFWCLRVGQGGVKRVDLFAEPYDEGNSLAVSDDGSWRRLSVQPDLSQVANRVIIIGGGSETTARTAQAATTIAVEETSWYSASGGDARASGLDISYTGRSMASGPGSLTGVTGVTRDIPQGETIAVRVQVDDTAQQTLMATRFGGASGIVAFEESDSAMTDAVATLHAASRLDELAKPNTEIRYRLVVEPTGMATDWSTTGEGVLEVRPGRQVTVGVTRPVCVNDTFRVRSVELAFANTRGNGQPTWSRDVRADLVIQRGTDPMALEKRALAVEVL